MERVKILFLAGSFLMLYAFGFWHGRNFGYEDGKAYQRFVDNNQLQSCNNVVANNKTKPEEI
jgi:hypothetical protein